MSTTPVAVQHPRREAPPEPPRLPTRGSSRRRVDPDRALRIGLGVSLALHLLAFFLLSRVVVVSVPATSPGRPSAERTRPPGTQVLNITVTPGARVAKTVPRRHAPLPPRTPPPQKPAAEAAPSQPAGQGTPQSPAERLRPHMGDRRLWVPMPAPPLPEKPENIQEVRERIAARLREVNDSALAAAEAAAKALDWTMKDKNGGVWGVTPGKLHLGKYTLPLPFSLPPASGEIGQREKDWTAIRQQAAEEAARENFKDRVKAIRERKEKEHEEKLKKEAEAKKKQKPKAPPPPANPPNGTPSAA